jgi:uncharacterized protein
MVQVPINIIEIINKFLEEVKKDKINISQAILFGSYAKGTQHEWSDIDLALVSNDFEGKRLKDRQKVRNAKLNTSIDIETHPYRPEDFNTENPFVCEILKDGIRIL